MVYAPPLSVVDVRGAFVEAFSKITTPVGVPPAQVTVPVRLPETVPAVPVTLEGIKVTVGTVPVALAVVQPLIRFVAFTEPSPVARSYPIPAVNAGLPPLTSTPNPPLVALLQFVEPPAQGTELFKFGVRLSVLLLLVMSWKIQVEGAEVLPESQLEKVSVLASAYSSTFALPCLCPVF